MRVERGHVDKGGEEVGSGVGGGAPFVVDCCGGGVAGEVGVVLVLFWGLSLRLGHTG